MTKRYGPLTQAQIDALRSQLVTAGFTVPEGNSGQLVDADQGVTIQFNYDGSNLDLQITEKPWWILSSEIWDAIGEYIQ